MGRNGGAQEMWWLGRSTANATCTVAETVQESLWKTTQLTPIPVMVVPANCVVESTKPATPPRLLNTWEQWLPLAAEAPLPLLRLLGLRHPLIFCNSIKGMPE